jgi:hypothetical protein
MVDNNNSINSNENDKIAGNIDILEPKVQTTHSSPHSALSHVVELEERQRRRLAQSAFEGTAPGVDLPGDQSGHCGAVFARLSLAVSVSGCTIGQQ